MDKQFKKKFFGICILGGLAFAVLFFLTFGAAAGYSWFLAWLCLGGAAFFAVAFYFIWLLVEKFSAPLTFENPKAQKKLAEYESVRNQPYEQKFYAFFNYGKGLKQAGCETVIYFESQKIHIAFCYFGKIHTIDIPYDTVENALVRRNFFSICSSTAGDTAYSLKFDSERLKEILINKGLLIPRKSENLFLSAADRAGTAYFEFQYCKERKAVEKFYADGRFFAEDSLLVHADDEEEFFENYRKYLEVAWDGEAGFDPYAVNYYTKEQTNEILQRIKEDKPKDFEVFSAWLEKAVTDYSGFYLLGL